jgi:hypothetical protein
MDGSSGKNSPRRLLLWLACVPPPGPWFCRLPGFCRFSDPLLCVVPFLPQRNRCLKNSNLLRENNCTNRGSRDIGRPTKTNSIYSFYSFFLLTACCLFFLPRITNSPTLINSLEPCKRKVTASVFELGLPKSVVISNWTVVAPAMIC